jgi:drug/metabolite transporter (DMT)-like permease
MKARLQRWPAIPFAFVVGGSAWALNMQLGQILPYPECASRLPFLTGSSFGLALLVAAAAFIDWRGRHDSPQPPPRRTAVFLKTLSALGGALFAYVLVLQGVSALMLTGCER